MRTLRYTIALLAGLTAAPAVAQEAVTLRPAALVDGDVVRLGDLFVNLGPEAETPIIRAPQPGRRMGLDSKWLASVAAAYKLPWRPLGRLDRIVVERRSDLVGAERVQSMVLDALALHGVTADSELQFAGRSLEMHVPVGEGDDVAVRDLQYDERVQRFSAVIETAGSAPQRLRVAGRVFRTAEVPVLARAMSRGDIVNERDIEWRSVRVELFGQNVLTDAADVLGKELRHAARPGVPLRANDVRRPVVVAKGSLVTMVLRSGSLMLTAQGRAVENGGHGDIIRITNSHTKSTVEARVENANMVSVLPMAQALAN